MPSPNKEFWNGKSVFITGHTGFKGRWMTDWLNHLKATVHGYSLPDNILDKEKLSTFIKAVNPDIVFHFAAQAFVNDSYIDPYGTFMTNGIGTASVLQACRNASNARSIIIITTDKVYQNSETGDPFLEDDKLGGHDPYSASKACAEIITQSYKSSFFREVGVATARSGNVIGGGDTSESRLVPNIFRAMEAGKPVMVKNPESIRPWQHVLEPLYGYLLLAQTIYNDPNKSGAYNFGPGVEDCITVSKVCDKFGCPWIIKQYNDFKESEILLLDNEKARKILGWQPTWHIDEAIKKILAWRGNNITQIKEFESR